jgi:hypothetical protein
MTYLGGQAGIQAGSTYAVAQSASMGGAAGGLVAAVGSMTVAAAVTAEMQRAGPGGPRDGPD